MGVKRIHLEIRFLIGSGFFLLYFCGNLFLMDTLKAWIAAARLRTLPLSVSGIIVGSSLANAQFYQSSLFWMAILVTVGFQVLSNFANDYGDGIKGTDKHRIGEKRMVASGIITPKQMKIGMIVVGGCTFFIATLLIFKAFGMDQLFMAFIFFNLAIASIIAAVRYTVGNKAYGYSGFGDLFVFLFFGLLSVQGSYFLFTKTLHWDLLLPAFAVGSFSTAVLNLNNLRDREQDAVVGKRTLVVKLGLKSAKSYHIFLVVFGILCALSYSWLNRTVWMQWIYVIAFIPLLINLKTVVQHKEAKMLDGELKKVALSTFLFAILMALFH